MELKHSLPDFYSCNRTDPEFLKQFFLLFYFVISNSHIH